MKQYTTEPRLIQWRDIKQAADLKPAARRALYMYVARIGARKRCLVWSIWRQSEKSVPASITETKTEYNALHRKRDIYNDLAFLAAARIVQNEEYTTAQENSVNDIKTRADEARRKRYAASMKQKIIRNFEMIEKLWRKYGDWSSVIQAIKRRPRPGDPDPFRELRTEKKLNAKYLSSVMSAERIFRA